MDIRPYYTDATGQANVKATPVLQAWRGPFKVQSGLMLGRPFHGVGLPWEDRPELEGRLLEEEAPAGMWALQVE